jgi:hypothetical protein
MRLVKLGRSRVEEIEIEEVFEAGRRVIFSILRYKGITLVQAAKKLMASDVVDTRSLNIVEVSKALGSLADFHVELIVSKPTRGIVEGKHPIGYDEAAIGWLEEAKKDLEARIRQEKDRLLELRGGRYPIRYLDYLREKKKELEYLDEEIMQTLRPVFKSPYKSGAYGFSEEMSLRRARLREERRQLKERLSELEKELDFSQRFTISSLEQEKAELEKEIAEKKRELGRHKELVKNAVERGVGIALLVTVRSGVYTCKEGEEEKCLGQAFSDVLQKTAAVAERLRSGFGVVLEEIYDHILLMSRLHLADPGLLEGFKQPEIAELREKVEGLYMLREKTDFLEALRSSIHSLFPRGRDVPEPELSRLPGIKDIGRKRLAYLGRIVEGGFRLSSVPAFFDIDAQGTRHTMITGGSGSGKSFAAYAVVEGMLLQGVPVIVFDATRSWTGFMLKCGEREMLRLYEDFYLKPEFARGFNTRVFPTVSVNLLSCPENSSSDFISALAEETSQIIRDICQLTPAERAFVEALIRERWRKGENLDYLKIVGAVDDFKAFLEESEEVRANVTVLKLKLGRLEGYRFLFEEGSFDIRELLEEGAVSVITPSGLSRRQYALLIFYLMRELYSRFSSKPETDKMRLCVVLEEAHRYLRRGERALRSILDLSIRELRKRGVGFILISQNQTDIPDVYRNNCSTKIQLQTGYTGDLYRISQVFGKEYADIVKDLPRGYGVIDFPEHGRYVVAFRPPLHAPRPVSDAIIELGVNAKTLEKAVRDLMTVAKKERGRGGGFSYVSDMSDKVCGKIRQAKTLEKPLKSHRSWREVASALAMSDMSAAGIYRELVRVFGVDKIPSERTVQRLIGKVRGKPTR